MVRADVLPDDMSSEWRKQIEAESVHQANVSAAEAGDVNAMLEVVKDLRLGRGCRKNPLEALKFRKKAAHNGDHRSMYALSLRHGISGSVKLRKAVKATRKHKHAKLTVDQIEGRCDALSFYWAVMAACSGSKRGMQRVAMHFARGRVVPKDELEATTWKSWARSTKEESNSDSASCADEQSKSESDSSDSSED